MREVNRTDIFFERLRPVRIGLTEKEVIAIMGQPDEASELEHRWGERARHEAAASVTSRIVTVPESLRGMQTTRKLLWRADQSPRAPSLTVYFVDGRVISTDTYSAGAKN